MLPMNSYKPTKTAQTIWFLIWLTTLVYSAAEYGIGNAFLTLVITVATVGWTRDSID